MRLKIVLCLLLTLTFLTACKSSPLPADPCGWSEPIAFSLYTKQWIVRGGALPGPVKADLWKIVQHNEKFAAICGKRGR